MGQLCEIDMDGATSSIRKARSFVDVTLTAWKLDGLRERAVLLTSELASSWGTRRETSGKTVWFSLRP